MSTKKLALVLGLSMLFTGCSTGTYTEAAYNKSATPTQLGMRYLLGRGVQQNDEKAFSYFMTAAKDDDPFAQNELGYMYAAGRGTPRNYEQSLFWYQKAADHGLASAQYNLGLLYLNGLGTPADKTKAMQWFEKSAANGFEPARVAVAKYRK